MLEALRVKVSNSAISAHASAQRVVVEQERDETMLQEVEAWEIPTPDHADLRDFMLEQLTVSMHEKAHVLQARNTIAMSEANYVKKELEKVSLVKAEEFRAGLIESCEWDRDYHKKQIEKYSTSSLDRQAWYDELVASLK